MKYHSIVFKHFTCFASSLALELAKLMQEQYSANQAHHFNFIISPHIEKIIPENGIQDKPSDIALFQCGATKIPKIFI